ncbi:MAG: hypothetical protein V1755_04365 [Chloroflexota bacterium]
MLVFLNFLIGGGLLVAGRKLFWLLVGAIGFLVGLEVATRITFRSELVLVLSVVALGVIFALMAIFLETVAISMAGFLGGGFVLMRLAALLGLDGGPARIVAFVVGGIVGVILIVWLFNLALIAISSLAGASMVVSGLVLRDDERPLLFLGLMVLGVLIQGLIMLRERPSPKSERRPTE